MDKSEIERLLRERGEGWAIAAIVDGSIGYYSPAGARMVLKDFLEGKSRCGSERCLACYKGDLLLMLGDDLQHFLNMEKELPERVAHITEFCREWDSVNEGPLSTMGLLYPVIN